MKLALGACRFFSLSFPQLTSLGWADPGADDVGYIFSNSPFTPTLRSLSLSGYWDGVLAQLNNLTSFTLVRTTMIISARRPFGCSCRTINPSSHSRWTSSVSRMTQRVPLLIFSTSSRSAFSSCSHILSTIIRVPALQRLSSLRITLDGSVRDLYWVPLGMGSPSRSKPPYVIPREPGRTLLDTHGPAIRHVRFCDYPETPESYGSDSGERVVIPLLADAHTLEVGLTICRSFTPAFWMT
jgi:hypothetical protein